MELFVTHDSHSNQYRFPFGAVKTGEKITIRLSVKCSEAVTVTLRLWFDNRQQLIPMVRVDDLFEAVIVPNDNFLMWYYFIINTPEGEFFYGNNSSNRGGVGELTRYQPPSFQITVYDKNFKTPDWFKKSVMYQIFVDRFYNGNDDKAVFKKRNDYLIHQNWDEPVFYNTEPGTSNIVNNDFFGGNLLGIMKKLDYLEELGITVIYLSPIFEAWSNHKYDTGDYMKIDPMFGDEEIFKSLCSEAKKRGISVVLDGVFSHTGSDSKYFNKDGTYGSQGAYNSPDSPYRSWYRFNSESVYGYDCWWGVPTLPNVNELEESYLDFIARSPDSVIRHWLNCGARGWRLDVADELPSKFIEELRTAVKETKKDAVLIGEVWEDASNKVSYGESREYLLGKQLDSVMNYPFKDAVIGFFLGNISGFELGSIVMSICENYPPPVLYSLMNLLDSHDVVRIKTLFGEAPLNIGHEEKRLYRLSPEQNRLADKRMRLAVLWQMTFIGVPCIYYGDEVGQQGHEDPFNRQTFPWNCVDLELLEWYKKLIKLRKDYPCLTTGRYIPLMVNDDVFCYLRIIQDKDVFGISTGGSSAVICAVNRSRSESYKFTVGLKSWNITSLKNLLNDKKIPVKKHEVHIELPPLGGICYGEVRDSV